MALTLLDALKTTQRPIAAAIMKELVMADELLSQIPFVPKGTDGFVVLREKSLPSFGFIPDSGATIGESTGKDERITVALRQAVSDFYVPAMSMKMSNAFQNQMVKKMKAAGLTLSDAIINGGHTTGVTVEAFQSGAYVDALVANSSYLDSYRDGVGTLRYTHTGTYLAFRAPGDAAYGPNVACATDGNYTLYSDNPSKWVTVTLDVSDATADTEKVIRFTSSTDEFDGLNVLITSGQTRASGGTNGDALSLEIMDELIDSVQVGGNLAFVAHSKIIRKFKSLLRAGGGVDTLTLSTGKVVPAYQGIPILRNDNVACNETKASGTTLSSLYLLSLGEDEGTYMGALGGEKFDVNADPREASLLGFEVSDLGPIQDPTAGNVRGGRVAWYGGLAMGSQKSAARAKELVTA